MKATLWTAVFLWTSTFVFNDQHSYRQPGHWPIHQSYNYIAIPANTQPITIKTKQPPADKPWSAIDDLFWCAGLAAASMSPYLLAYAGHH